MGNEGLTAKEVEHAKPRNVRYEVAAGDNLFLIVQPSGAKSWAFRYRWNGKTRKLTFGSYPDIKLAKARIAADTALNDLKEGRDPAAVKAEEEATKPDTVEAVAEEWFVRHIRVNVDWPEAERILKQNVVKDWKHKLITDFTRKDVLRVLDKMIDRGAAVQANRTLAVMRAWFNWCVDRGILPISPAAGVKAPTVEQSRDRVLEAKEITDVWAAAPSLAYPIGPFLQFLLLTAQRKNEVARMKWAHVDLNTAMWTLPSEATKAGRVHDVPLSDEALATLRGLPRFKYIDENGKEVDGEYVWTTTSGRLPINGFSKAKRRIDAATLQLRKKAGRDQNISDWTFHDLRRTAATNMAKSGVPPHVLSAILNHTPGSTQGVTSIYNRFRYTEERRQALEAWALYLLSLAEEKPATKKAATA